MRKFLKAYRQGNLVEKIHSRIMPYIYGMKYILHDPSSELISLHCPEYVEPINDDDEKILVERIYKSFRKMKDDQ
jgi:hypothetical protein